MWRLRYFVGLRSCSFWRPRSPAPPKPPSRELFSVEHLLWVVEATPIFVSASRHRDVKNDAWPFARPLTEPPDYPAMLIGWKERTVPGLLRAPLARSSHTAAEHCISREDARPGSCSGMFERSCFRQSALACAVQPTRSRGNGGISHPRSRLDYWG